MSTQILRDVLVSIENLSEGKKRFVADHEIAENLGITVQQVRDYLVLLSKKEFVDIAEGFGGYAVHTTSLGRIALHDPNVLMSDTPQVNIVLSGDFRNSILNIDSTLNNLSQVIDQRNVDPIRTQEIKQLIDQLNDTLKNVSPENVQDAEAVAEATKAFIDAATKPKPNKATIEITKDGLLKAAHNIAVVMPIVVEIALKIVKKIQEFQ